MIDESTRLEAFRKEQAESKRTQPKSPNVREDDHSWIDIAKQEPPTEGLLIDMHLIVDPHGFEVARRYDYWYRGKFSGKDGKNRLTHWRLTTSAPIKELTKHLEEMRARLKAGSVT